VLSPVLATNIVGSSHTIVATVTSNNVPRVGAIVTFAVDAGPNRGKSGSAITSISGQASFSYTGGTTPGLDRIRATVLGVTATATNVWIALDSVGDGIPDWWRAQYFGGTGTTTNSQSCASCDADGTGQNNLFKYVAGLNPTNPESVFVLSIQSVNGQPGRKSLVYSPVVAGRTYSPQFRTSLVSDGWAALTDVLGPTTNLNQATITDVGATQAFKFYRLQISSP
jgi:hypothetical protein